MQPARMMRQGLWVGEGEFSCYGAEQKRKEKKNPQYEFYKRWHFFGEKNLLVAIFTQLVPIDR